MPTIALLDFESSTSVPAGLNVSASGVSVDATSKLSGANSLKFSTTGLLSAFYATKDGKAGQVEDRWKFRVDSPGTSSAVRVLGRLDDPAVANFGTSSNGYVGELTLGTSNAADFKIYRQTGATTTTLATGNAALRTALSAATAYEVRLITNGTTAAASGGTQVAMQVVRVSDGLFLTSAGAWQATDANCLSNTDSTAPISGLSGGYYSGVQSNLAAGAAAYFDDFNLWDFVDLANYVKTWSDDSGWTQGVGTVAPNVFGSESAITIPATSASKSVVWGGTDRRYGNAITWTANFKLDSFAAGAHAAFRVGGYYFNLDVGAGSVTFRDSGFTTVLATIAFNSGSWVAGRQYRLIAVRTATTVKFAVRDSTNGFTLNSSGNFVTGFAYCFSTTLGTPASPGTAITLRSDSSTASGANLSVGTITAGPAGTPAVTPNPATVARGGTQAFAPTAFEGVLTTGSAASGTYNNATNTYTAPASGTSDTVTLASSYGTGQSVAVPVTLTGGVATSYTAAAPTRTAGPTGTAVGPYTLTPSGGTSSATVTATFTGAGSTGLSPITVTFDGTSAAKTFSFTPTAAGSITITFTNNGGLADPSALAFTAYAPLSTAYVATAGSDNTTNGGSSSAPFATTAAAIAALNTASAWTLNLNGGDTFSGQLAFTTPGTVQSYGTGQATVTAAGNAISFTNCAGWTVSNLRVINSTTSGAAVLYASTDSTRRTAVSTVQDCVISGGSRGIYFYGTTGSSGGLDNWQMLRNEVYGSVACGIQTDDNGSSSTDKHFSNGWIYRCRVHDVTGSASFSGSGVVVAANDTASGPTLVERCTAYSLGASAANVAGPAGFFPLRSSGVIIRSCLSFDILANTAGDNGDGFDFDISATNCTIEDCYSYRTQGSSFLFYSSGSGNVLRNNIGVDSGRYGLASNSGIRIFTSASQKIYNNLIYNPATLPALCTTGSGPTNGKTLLNNVFVTGTGIRTIDTEAFAADFKLEQNVYQSGTAFLNRVGGTDYTSLANFRSGTSRETGHGFATVAPFNGYGTPYPTPTDAMDIETALGDYFTPPPGSAWIGAGIDVTQSPYSFTLASRDIKGNPISVPYSVGPITTPANLSPSGIGPGEAFGAATVASGTPPPLSVAPTGIASGQAFGAATASLGTLPPIPVSPSGVPSSEAFGAGTVAVGTLPPIPVSPTGVPSAEAFGAPTASLGTPPPIPLAPTGIASGEAIGGPVVSSGTLPPIVVAPPGVGTGEAFGAPSVGLGTLPPQTIAPTGIPSAEATGTPAASVGTPPPIAVSPGAIPSAEAFGNPTIGTTGDDDVTPEDITAIADQVLAKFVANTAGVPAKVVSLNGDPTALANLILDSNADPAAQMTALRDALSTALTAALGTLDLSDATVAASPTPNVTQFSATGATLDAPTNGYLGMTVFFQTGANGKVKRRIIQHTVSGSRHDFVLAGEIPLPVAPAPGDKFKVV